MEYKIKLQLKQLNPNISFKDNQTVSNRHRRGLINAIGSIVKIISGNLDNEDALRYDKEISELKNNQNNLKLIAAKQITLMQRAINNFQENIQSLAHNQILLKSRIMQIESEIKKQNIMNLELYHYFLLQVTLSQFVQTYQIIYDILDKIEVAITFSKLQTFHNSIIEPSELMNEIYFIDHNIDNIYLPFEPIIQNLILFEQIITTKSYSNDKKIIFIMEIPLTAPTKYNYYHLYPIPTIINNKNQTLLTNSKYLALNDENYVLFNEECKNLQTNEFFCMHLSPSKINIDTPCEVKILTYSENITNCNYIPINFDQLKIQKLENSDYLILTNKQIVATQNCQNIKDHVSFNGNYLLTFDNNKCTLRLENITLKSFKNTNRINQFNIPKVNNLINFKPFQNVVDFKSINIKNINLDDIKDVHRELNLDEENLDKINISPVIHYSVSFWTVLLYVIILITIFTIFVYKFVLPYKCKIRQQHNKNASTETIDNQEDPNISIPYIGKMRLRP